MDAGTEAAKERLLTERQERFITEYLGCRETLKAALRAGYSEKTARHSGWRLLKNPQIRQKIEAGLAAARQRQAVGQETVMAELARVAFASADQGDAAIRMADKLRALDILARILGLNDAKKHAEATPDLAEQLRRARLRVERMKKEDEEKLKKQQEAPPPAPEMPPVVEIIEPVAVPQGKERLPSMIRGRHPESPFPLDPTPSGHTGWQNFEFDPYGD